MFGKILKMEFARAFRLSRMILVMFIILLLLLGSDWNLLEHLLKYGYFDGMGIIEYLQGIFAFDTFKCVFVVLLAGLYTSSFCKDNNSKYLRMILSRTNVAVYTQCRFIANVCVIFVVSIVSMYVLSFIMSPVMPLLKNTRNILYYVELAENYPVLYVGIYGYIFALVAAASSSVGLLFSVYKPNSLVSIGLSGLVFYIAISYLPFGTPFNVLNLVGMKSTIGANAPWQMMFIWANFYMLSVTGICGVLFYRRMKWRVENGLV